MSWSTVYIVYDHANMFAILNVMNEAVILCDACNASSINNRLERSDGVDQSDGFYVEEIKLSMNGICIEKKIINGSKTRAIENRQCVVSVVNPINIIDCVKLPKISDQPYGSDDDEYVDQISVLEDQFDEAYGLKKNIGQKMDDPVYIKRCTEQWNRRDEERQKEKMSVFRSGKSTYVKIKTKINKGTMRIIDISGLFADKYMIYDFMETKKLIDITSNIDDYHEYKVFQQLELVIESYWWEINETNMIKNNNDRSNNNDPSDNMDPIYSDMVDDFYIFIEENGGMPKLERDMHQHLNMSSDNHIFERDCSNE